MSDSKSAYAEAGVDIDLAHTLLDRAKAKIKAARRPEMLTDIGGFGGLFQLDLSRWKEPVLVSSVDGVGTKLMVAAMADNHETVGFDIVNHCINDVAVCGAEPLWFMDYVGIGKLRSPLYEQILGGIADACKAQHVALLGGETAEMPGMYGDDYDLVGSITGVVEKSKILTGDAISAGDAVIGLASSGLHTNGYSLARKVLFDKAGFSVESAPDELGGETVGEALLHPHVCYMPAIRQARANGVTINGMAHITGGGFLDNIPRVLPTSLDAVIDRERIAVPAIFKLIEDRGAIDREEMYRVFNMGVGMVWMVPDAEKQEAVAAAQATGCPAAVIGRIDPGSGVVQLL